MLKELFRRLFKPEKSCPVKEEKAQPRIEQTTAPVTEPPSTTADGASSGNENGEQRSPKHLITKRSWLAKRQSKMSPSDFRLLAKWCSMGHLPSIRRMCEHFESQISEETKERLSQYLTDSTMTQEAWDTYLEAKQEDCFNVRAYAWWLCRLAQFGEDEASCMTS